jgi:hypothetical protein
MKQTVNVRQLPKHSNEAKGNRRIRTDTIPGIMIRCAVSAKAEEIQSIGVPRDGCNGRREHASKGLVSYPYIEVSGLLCKAG